MENDLILKTTKLSLHINSDPNNILEFDPDDMLFTERYAHLLVAFEEKVKEYSEKYDEIESQATDEKNLALTTKKIELAKESCIFVRDQIDYVFGEGTSQKLFGDTLSMTAFGNFFEAITPFIKKARAQKMAKYQNTPNGKKRVMK